MPRKKRIYWMKVPTDLTKCHSRRCEKSAVAERLCAEHHAIWLLDGKLPPMPRTYFGEAAQPIESPLKAALRQEKAVLDAAINAIASVAIDDEASSEQLEATLAELEAERARIADRKRESLMPFQKAYTRTKKMFEPVEGRVEDAIRLTQSRLEAARSTVRAIAPKVKTKAKKAG